MCYEKCCGQDMDEVFAYQTPRLVKIRDRAFSKHIQSYDSTTRNRRVILCSKGYKTLGRFENSTLCRKLGILNLTFVVLIFGYIVGFNFLWQKGYRKLGNVVGTARLQVLTPTLESYYDPSNLTYCSQSQENGKLREGVVPKALDGSAPSTVLPCRCLDEYNVVYPPIETSAIFMTTRMSEKSQYIDPSCVEMPHPNCQYKPGKSLSYFVADLTYFTVWIDHTMAVPEYNISRSASDMTGVFLGNDGKPMTQADLCQPYTEYGIECPKDTPSRTGIHVGGTGSEGQDVVALATILNATGIENLDAPSGTAASGQKPESIRSAGIVLVLSIFYTNMESFNNSVITYEYSVSAVRGAEYKGEQIDPPPGVLTTNRTVYDRHGVRIIVRQSGRVGIFDVTQLLIVSVTSLGLLAIAGSVVNFLAFNCMKMKYVYQQYRTVTSTDFSEIAHLPERVIDDFARNDYINPRPAIFAEFDNHETAGGVVGTGLRTTEESGEINGNVDDSKGFLSSLNHDQQPGKRGVNPMAVDRGEADASASYRSSLSDPLLIPGFGD